MVAIGAVVVVAIVIAVVAVDFYPAPRRAVDIHLTKVTSLIVLNEFHSFCLGDRPCCHRGVTTATAIILRDDIRLTRMAPLPDPARNRRTLVNPAVTTRDPVTSVQIRALDPWSRDPCLLAKSFRQTEFYWPMVKKLFLSFIDAKRKHKKYN